MGGADAVNAHLMGRGMFIGRSGPSVSTHLCLCLSLSKPSNSSIHRDEKEEEGEENK